MLQIPDDEKKRIICRRILKELAEYYIQHHKGMPMSILSAKYNKACTSLGSFPSLLEEMQRDGFVFIEYAEGGARTVYLKAHAPKGTGGIAVGNGDKNKEWF